MPTVAKAKSCADYYRKLGLCPLPSKMNIKGPMLKTYHEHYRGTPVPTSVYDNWKTTNIQVVTGVKTPTPTKIIVVDLDGAEAVEAWDKIARHHEYYPMCVWKATTGSGGTHLYFRVDPSLPECPSGIVWGIWDTWGSTPQRGGLGDWVKHKEIRILADNSLAIAPPSVHVDTGRPYVFAADASPRIFRLPEFAPQWLLDMPRLQNPRFSVPEVKRYKPKAYTPSSNSYTREAVLDAIGSEKIKIATSEWGLRLASFGPNAMGWVSCWVPKRENPKHSRPSGSFHCTDGVLQDRRDLSCITFFDLGVVLGAFATWQDCCNSLGDRFIGHPLKAS